MHLFRWHTAFCDIQTPFLEHRARREPRVESSTVDGLIILNTDIIRGLEHAPHTMPLARKPSSQAHTPSWQCAFRSVHTEYSSSHSSPRSNMRAKRQGLKTVFEFELCELTASSFVVIVTRQTMTRPSLAISRRSTACVARMTRGPEANFPHCKMKPKAERLTNNIRVHSYHKCPVSGKIPQRKHMFPPHKQNSRQSRCCFEDMVCPTILLDLQLWMVISPIV
jgi:hypothetical protein